jgi:succinate-semialdehyde dehydrogenase/glutarate-semialdehyde dehydrogenase
MTLEMGKTITEGLAEVEYAAGYFDWFAGEAERVYGTFVPSRHIHKRVSIVQRPVGPSAMITPWNFPIAMASRKIAAALAAGCTAVVKPAQECPLSLLSIASIAQEEGLPPGCLNVFFGDPQEIGEAFLTSGIIRKLTFTGSTNVGRYLYQNSAATLKKLTLELGGHAPFIVYDDANLQKAAEQAIASKFRNNGQTCVCPNRFYIHSKIHDEFVSALTDMAKQLKIGDPLDPKTNLSTAMHPTSVVKVKRHIEDALSKGAKVVLGGEEVFEPTILTGITEDMLISQEETFGPVIAISCFDSLGQVIEMANHTPYGLAAYVFTDSIDKGHKTVELLDYGVIGLNDGAPSAPEISFGGVKTSGFGREGGPSGIYEYLVEKTVSMAF